MYSEKRKDERLKDISTVAPEKYIKLQQLEIDKYWSELLTAMTTDENGKIRAGDERELRRMNTEEFYIKVFIFKEMLDARLSQIKKVA